ncbi:hypothetical protein BDP27DRAFT_1367538 [Rhodocollybia butyracea]|uniref:Uncharacterized protein n=1 Tax=Rhodocollybia butyracea TaxID=206335 RepID=A0A9P5PF03_9AGAR|nr:hypothetical protein BDP27DRAFT_1367538 [Rhodocollybia butyracea]
MSSGRPVGTHDKPGHLAGGQRDGAGRPASGAGSSMSSNKRLNLRDNMLQGEALLGAAFGGSRIAPIFGSCFLDKQMQKQKEKPAAFEAVNQTSSNDPGLVIPGIQAQNGTTWFNFRLKVSKKLDFKFRIQLLPPSLRVISKLRVTLASKLASKVAGLALDKR